MTRIVFVDTETTSLRHDRRAWEIGLIVREPGTADTEHHWFIESHDLDLGNADPFSLKIGRFYERHPQYGGVRIPDIGDQVGRSFPPCEGDVLLEVERLTRGAHLVGAVVSFDADVLGTRMRANGICPSWHYHLIDVEALTVGYLAGVADGRDDWSAADVAAEKAKCSPPWKSDALSAALRLPPVPDDERHTALGDARWARSIYDAVMRP
jgi:DNA polymerase III epsilon subunit-like protein